MSFSVISFLLEPSGISFISEPDSSHPTKVNEKNPLRANPYLYIRPPPMFALVKTRMDEKQKNFWIGTGIGAVVIIIIDLIIPLLGPFLGGFVAGYIARGDSLNTGRAGLIAGIVAGVVISIVVFAGLASHWVSSYAVVIGGFLLYIMITFYLAVIAFLGGAIAGAVRK